MVAGDHFSQNGVVRVSRGLAMPLGLNFETVGVKLRWVGGLRPILVLGDGAVKADAAFSFFFVFSLVIVLGVVFVDSFVGVVFSLVIFLGVGFVVLFFGLVLSLVEGFFFSARLWVREKWAVVGEGE